MLIEGSGPNIRDSVSAISSRTRTKLDNPEQIRRQIPTNAAIASAKLVNDDNRPCWGPPIFYNAIMTFTKTNI